MNAKALLLPGCLALGAALYAPPCAAQSTWQIGLRIIPQATSLRHETGFPLLDFLKIVPYYFRVRPALGLGVVYQPYKHWYIGADLLYSMQGGGYEARRTNINYLKVPLWLGYSAADRRKVMFNLQAGLDVAYLVRATMHYQDGETVNIARYVNRTTWGPTMAIGAAVHLGEGYRLNTQLLVATDVRTLSRTEPSFGVHNYILPGLRFSLDRPLTPGR